MKEYNAQGPEPQACYHSHPPLVNLTLGGGLVSSKALGLKVRVRLGLGPLEAVWDKGTCC